MKEIDQNIAIRSLNQHLFADPLLIDGRTEIDMLAFLSGFATLINFYDQDNKVNGNWKPFLLKDPFFLLASISKTNISEPYANYLNICTKLQKMLLAKQVDESYSKDLPNMFNQLFDQLTNVFMHIKEWMYYMQKFDGDYELKNYVIRQFKLKYSQCFWAVIYFRKDLFLSSAINGISPIDTGNFLVFDSYNETVWKQDADKNPYWEILQFKHPINENSHIDFFQALKKVGDDLFELFHSIVHHSTTAFENLKVAGGYPDTTLLRTFVHVLKIHQIQLNDISSQHLEFYYKEILQQTKELSKPDHVFVCAELAKKDATFNLSKGILFNAGLDAQEIPVLYETTEASYLNPAIISAAFTLAKQKNDGFYSFQLQNILNPGIVQQDENGHVNKWNTFGGALSQISVSLTSGIIFSSPILLLREGQRNITLNVVFEKEFDIRFLQHATFYLSTQLAWLPVAVQGLIGKSNTATVLINLDAAQPSIECFTKSPDEVSNALWPMLKIEFNSFSNGLEPVAPVITSLEIKVDVANIKTLQLYNDFGLLSTKLPYQPFGPAPLLNSSFMIGSNEIFSKPLSSFIIELDWDTLPNDFSDYYQPYNEYLNSVKNGVENPLAPISIIENQINNNCFTANTYILENKVWNVLYMHKQNSCAIENNNTFSCIPYKSVGDNAVMPNVSDPLFTTIDNGKDAKLIGSSFYAYQKPLDGKNAWECYPTIQNTVLELTETSANGFMKITLSGPSFGFGSQIYPNVVYNTASANEIILAQKEPGIPLKTQPNQPFAPKLKSVTAHYSASDLYKFNTVTETNPLQVFSYFALENHKLFDSNKTLSDNAFGMNRAIGTSKKNINGVPLFSSFLYDGYLLLEMKDLIPAKSINLYFELTREYDFKTVNEAFECFYLNKNGWTKLLVLADGTNNLSCTGIIQVNVPTDIANENFIHLNNNCWICLAIKGNPLSYAQTVLVKTNGIKLERSKSSVSTDTPILASHVVTGLQNTIPQIANMVQPFPSFGGRVAENNEIKNQRVSYRLKTKDRAVTAADFYLLVKQEFPDVFYSKTNFNSATKTIETYVLKGYNNSTEPNAFTPLINSSRIKEINTFLSERTSGFNTIQVLNFNVQYVQLVVDVETELSFQIEGIKGEINNALNLFLSPWIKDSGKQIAIGQPISNGQISRFLMEIKGVLKVNDVSFQVYSLDESNNKILDITAFTNKGMIKPTMSSIIFNSYMDHLINISFK